MYSNILLCFCVFIDVQTKKKRRCIVRSYVPCNCDLAIPSDHLSPNSPFLPPMFLKCSSQISVSRVSHPQLAAHLMMSSLSPITNNLHPTNHLTNSEEAQKFCSNNRTSNDLLSLDITERLQDARRVGGCLVGSRFGATEKCVGVADGFQNTLEVVLES